MNELIADDIYHPLRGMNIDSNGMGLRKDECVDALNVIITQQDVRQRGGSELLGDGFPQPEEDVIEYARYIDPLNGATFFAFCSTRIYKFVAGAGWLEVTGYDGVGGGLIENLTITQWSITPCIDDAIGASIVAVASQYVRPQDPQEGGSSRMMIYYDMDADIYKELDMVSVIPVSEEGTGVTWPNAAGIVTGDLDSAVVTDFVKIEPGSAVFYTALEGVIARSGDAVVSILVGGVPTDCYRLIPSNDDVVKYGDTSYVTVDGTEWSIEFYAANNNTPEILVDLSLIHI